MSSRRAKRMEKHHKRRSIGALNLVSLMDIFTILVFFLLVNSQDVETLPNTKDLQLPTSYADEKAGENVVIMVTDENILVQGKSVASLAEVSNQSGVVIAALEQELRRQTQRLLRDGAELKVADQEVTIMGDHELPYSLLKKVMASCTAADYSKIFLAVTHEEPQAVSLMASTGT
jgi:biopolymer transport protein TolR